MVRQGATRRPTSGGLTRGSRPRRKRERADREREEREMAEGVREERDGGAARNLRDLNSVSGPASSKI